MIEGNKLRAEGLESGHDPKVKAMEHVGVAPAFAAVIDTNSVALTEVIIGPEAENEGV